MSKKKKKEEELKEFSYYLEQLSYAHDRYTVFDDFLTMFVCALSMGLKEEEYHKTIKKYSREELDLFVSAFTAIMFHATRNDFSDVFGNYFEEHLYSKSLDQFFTPESICKLLAQIVHSPRAGQDTGEEKDKRVYDPCCGSGRLLLSSAKMNKDRYFIGADISRMCCKMTLINLCLYGLRGEVLHKNSLSDSVWCRWFVMVDELTKAPFIYEMVQEENPNTAATVAPEKENFQEVEIIEKISPILSVLPKSRGFIKFGTKA